jgi:hypothetical protein
MEDEATCDACMFRMQEPKLYNDEEQAEDTGQAGKQEVLQVL